MFTTVDDSNGFSAFFYIKYFFCILQAITYTDNIKSLFFATRYRFM